MTLLTHVQLRAPNHGEFSAASLATPLLGSKSICIPKKSQRTFKRSQNTLITAATSASLSSNELATYRLPHHSTVGHSSAAPWFAAAVTEVVKHLHTSPFLQLVRFATASDPLAAFKEPKFSSFSVPETVVKAPELWNSIAESVTADTADVVILVQRVDPHGTGAIDITTGAPTAAATHPVDDSLKAHVEEACQKLVASGIGESILQGKVGECCEHQAGSSSTSSTSSISTAGIVPFSSSHRSTSSLSATARGASVKVKALGVGDCTGASSSSTPLSGYWGVVVQSKHHTGAEGCYLLRAVRQVCPPVESDDHGCTCTHYSLTKVCKGEHMERQFIDSWLV